MKPYVVIGAGPSGLAAVRRLVEQDIPVIGVETHADVGGLWDINSSTSTMYDSAHLISSKSMTQFNDFPMRDEVATYPKHTELQAYFSDFADHFDLKKHYRFNTYVSWMEPVDGGWKLSLVANGVTEELDAAGVVLANGTLHEPKRLNLPGDFSGEQLHSSEYRDPAIFAGKRVLIVGCGNSGCDIAVDAVHRAKSVDMVVRRGYYFLPKFVMGKPTDTLGGLIKMPGQIKQVLDGLLVRLISGKPSQFGLPDPDYKMYESHPVINSMFLHHIGHGDISVRPNITEVSGNEVHFEDGKRAEYDLILEATGYVLHFPFIDRKHLNWQREAPDLYLKMFTPEHDNLFCVGMVEAAGLGWQPRDDQARIIARFIKGRAQNETGANKLWDKIRSRVYEPLNAGFNYLKLERMSFYVNKQAYLDALKKTAKQLEG